MARRQRKIEGNFLRGEELQKMKYEITFILRHTKIQCFYCAVQKHGANFSRVCFVAAAVHFFSILQQSREIQIMNAIFRVLWDCVLLHSCSLSFYTIVLHFANLSSAIHPTNILFVCTYCSELTFLSCYPSIFFLNRKQLTKKLLAMK